MKACQNNGKQNIIWCTHQTYIISIVRVSANLVTQCVPYSQQSPQKFAYQEQRRSHHFLRFLHVGTTARHRKPWLTSLETQFVSLLGSKLRTMDTDIQPCTYRIKILSSYSLQVFSNDFTDFLGFSSCIEMDPGYTNSSLNQRGLITAPSIETMQRL